MVSKKYWKSAIDEFLTLVKQKETRSEVKILRTKFQVLPGVFSPEYSSDTAWFAGKILPLTKGKTFLEIGSGTGVIACLVALNNASSVVATDINPKAIKNIRLNAQLHNQSISIREGSTFDPIRHDELFDIIFWNHPFYYTDEKFDKNSMLEKSVCDTNYEALESYLKRGKKHLKRNGLLLLGTSNIARINIIKSMSKKEGYKTSLLAKTEVPIYRGKKTKMDIRIYSFTP
ncbi:MAG: methyltransferase [Simkaniaceae bacterium]|nr:methyltransferase [Candidatus Sacchlamyda saccharinae]